MTFNKFFNKDIRVLDIKHEQDFSIIVNHYRNRLIEWYFTPLLHFPVTGHEAFPVLISTCVAISQATRHFWDQRYSHSGLVDSLYVASLREIDKAFRDDDNVVANAFINKVYLSLVNRGMLDDTAGISGIPTLHMYIEPKSGQHGTGVDIFNPWILRDRTLAWINQGCDDMIATPHSNESGVFMDNLRRDFGFD